MTAALIVLGLIALGALLAAGCIYSFVRPRDEDRPAHLEGGGLNAGCGPRPAVRRAMDRNERRR